MEWRLRNRADGRKNPGGVSAFGEGGMPPLSTSFYRYNVNEIDHGLFGRCWFLTRLLIIHVLLYKPSKYAKPVSG